MQARAHSPLRDPLPMSGFNSSFVPVPSAVPGLLCRQAFVLAPYFIYSRSIPAGWTLILPPFTLLEGGKAPLGHRFLGWYPCLEA